ncbi:uncharacterized protein LOC131251692 [Magnolia sinica]|uniref:uncharacterized protein LOC131251692 n=1 Tax=Magnolia sinica TaxID=86752 RepID=UPI00265903CA|nr:uncharacterized protein LOC131251692 [Magnolia sinica]
MPVRFKFRSSVDYDSVEIDGHRSISVRDLRIKIVQHKNLKICDDFDLVISDAETGNAFDDEDFMVADGTNVIIRRVPAGRSAPSDMLHINSFEHMTIKGSDFVDAIGSSPTTNVDMDNFDDFGIDLYPAPEASLSDLDPDVDKRNCTSSEKANHAVQRCSEPSISRCQNIEPSDVSEAISRGIVKKHCDVDNGVEGELQVKLQSKTEENKKLNEEVDTSTPTMPNTDLPAELRCSLCNTIFKDAVMIPCCQHSFCNKCIRSVLVEKAKCPKCSSTKCRVDDLLPNVSLRQAIEHFLESQILISGSDNILPKYAPDGESGIQAKEASCAMSIPQREPLLPHSPTATGKGSNQVTPESAYESRARNTGVAAGNGSRIIHLNTGKSVKSTPSLHKIKPIQSGNERDSAADQAGLRLPVDFQGDSNSASSKKKGLWVNTDGSGSFIPTSRYRKGDRNCYMCGSPDHLVRDCPAASSPYSMLQTGDGVFQGGISAYGPQYWQGPSLPHVRPFANLYGAPGMMPFDPTMVPVTPFAVPPYMPSMYAGMPVPCGFMRMGGTVPPMMAGAERPLSRAEFMELQDKERRRKFSNEHLQRELIHDGDDDSSECYRYDEPQRRSRDCKPLSDREMAGSDSEDSGNWRLRKKHQHDKHSDSLPRQRSGFVSDDEDIHSVSRKHEKGSHFSATGRDSSKAYYSEKSNVEIQDTSDSSNRHSRDRHKHHRRSSSKKHGERIEQCGSESSRKSHHRSWKEVSDDRKREETDMKKHSRKRSSHSATGLVAPSSSGDRKRHRKEEESRHSSRHSRHKVKSMDDDLLSDRWEMGDGLDQENQEDYHYHKHKRTH